ncbi:MAG: hypothetical protein M3222_05990, partial [Thermoproteota archaeon]|nr:hypothetical protein [Thermoproteota archaeon]
MIFLLILITTTIDKPPYHEVFAASPAFNRQEITDEFHDGIHINIMGQSQTKDDYISKLDESTDIQKVTYSSNGTVLTATVWLASGFEEKPSANGSNVAVIYGILIDADNNQETGKEGVDYHIEIQWRNETQTWNKGIVEYSSPVHNRTIDTKEDYTGFYKKDERYVLLSLNLDEILSPNPYKAMFYTGAIYNNSDMKIDLSSWVDISPPVYSISTLPNPVIVRQGEQKTIGAQLKSTTGIVPDVIDFMPVENYSSIELEFNRDELNKSSSGIEPAPIKIEVPKNAQVGQYIIPISANISTGSTFPYFEFVEFSNVNLPSNSTEILTKGHKIALANLTISVVEPLSIQEQLRDFWSVYG